MVVTTAAFLLQVVASAGASCAPPSVCAAPPASSVRLNDAVHPRVQWNFNGGFCGAFSLQTTMMAHGAWVSEDLVRKANIGAACFGHGNGPNSTVCQAADDADCRSAAPGGCEVGPENYAATCAGLRLDCDVWDYAQRPLPQAPAYKAWLKAHLVRGVPVVWVPLLKGASNTPYGNRSCPGGGHFNHHEPVLGIGSNRSLDPASAAAAAVYDDDWLAHLSDEDEEKGGLATYYRTFGSLQDGVEMGGNCAHADREHACAYPCFDEQVTYGIAVRAFAREGAGAAAARPVGIEVGIEEEPDPREGGKPVRMHASVTVRALTVGARYVLYRYGGINAFPASGVAGYDSEVAFTATATEWNHRDPEAFMSDDAVYYLAVPSKARPVTHMYE